MDIVSVIKPNITDLLAREEQSVSWNIGQFDSQEEAEQAIREFGYGGYVQKTTMAEFYTEKF